MRNNFGFLEICGNPSSKLNIQIEILSGITRFSIYFDDIDRTWFSLKNVAISYEGEPDYQPAKVNLEGEKDIQTCTTYLVKQI